MCHVSCVMCHVSRVTCHVSHVTCQMALFCFFNRTKWWNYSVEGLLSTGPTPSSFHSVSTRISQKAQRISPQSRDLPNLCRRLILSCRNAPVVAVFRVYNFAWSLEFKYILDRIHFCLVVYSEHFSGFLLRELIYIQGQMKFYPREWNIFLNQTCRNHIDPKRTLLKTVRNKLLTWLNETWT